MIYHIVTEAEFLDCFNGDVYIPPSLAALQVASKLGPGHTVATLACDTGLKYLSTDLYTH